MPAESRASVPPRYELIEIDIIGFAPDADTQGRFGINNRGEVAYTRKSGASSRAMLYLPSPAYGFDTSQSSTINLTDVFGTMTVPEEDGFFYGSSYARDINDSGFIVGQFGGVESFEGWAFVVDLADHFGWPNRSFKWRQSDLSCVDTEEPSACVNSWARAMAVTAGENPTVIVETGMSRVCMNPSCHPGCPPNCPVVCGCFSMAGALNALGSSPTWQALVDIDCPCHESAFPFPSNLAFDAEFVSGTGSLLTAGFAVRGPTESSLGCGTESFNPCGNSCFEAVRWGPGEHAAVLQPVGTHGAVARGVNRAGDLVGFGFVSDSGETGPCEERAALWDAGGTTVTSLHLAVAAVADESRAESINRFGTLSQVVGWDRRLMNPLLWTKDSAGQWNGWVLQVGGGPQHAVIDCDDCDVEGQIVKLHQALDVNDDGWIIVWGERGNPASSPGAYRLFLLKPVDVCGRAGDLDQSGEVNLADLLLLLAAWGDCGDEWCPADLDGSGTVDMSDLFVLFANRGPCNAPSIGLPTSVEECIQRVRLDPVALSACLTAIP